MGAPRLSEEAKFAILAAYARGEKISVIASQFNVHQSYPRLLFKRRRDGVNKTLPPSFAEKGARS